MKSNILNVVGLLAVGITVASGGQADQPKMNGKLKVATLRPEEICYTGKPYNKELEAYVFNFRNYDPKINRWTSADSSGFPDGPNNQIYTATPTTTFDVNGQYLAYTAPAGATPYYHDYLDANTWNTNEAWQSVSGNLLAVTAMTKAEIGGGSAWTLSSTDAGEVKDSNLYQNKIYGDLRAFISGVVSSGGTYASSPNTKYTFTSSDSDLYNAFGSLKFSLTGWITFDSAGMWKCDGYVSFFTTVTAAGTGVSNLETNGWISSYLAHGNFFDVWHV